MPDMNLESTIKLLMISRGLLRLMQTLILDIRVGVIFMPSVE